MVAHRGVSKLERENTMPAFVAAGNRSYYGIETDIHITRDGRFIEEVGFYNPMKNPAEITVDAEKAKKWISNGAQPTDTVRDLLKKSGVLD